MGESQEITGRRQRLAELDGELANLQAQQDLAMSAFKFDEANALQRRIEALEDERQAVAATLPPRSAVPDPETGIVPVLARPRRLRRRR